MNEYSELLQQKLCTKYYCTTCGNMEFRGKCKNLGDRLFQSMMELTEDEVMNCHNYLESINITVRCIPDIEKRKILSEHWPRIFKMLLEKSSLGYNGFLLTGFFREFETPNEKNKAMGQEKRIIHTYKYELVDGHIIIIAAQLRLLIDTGAPSSVADSSPLVFAGRSYRTQRNYMGISPESLSTNVGAPINALVGADILNQYDILIDPTAHTVNMSEDELQLAGQSLKIDNFMGIPIVQASVAGQTIRMFFDTGAKLSYLDPERTNAFQAVGTEKDFYPWFGEFFTNVYDIPIVLAKETVVLRVGNLPELLQMTLMMANTDGIIGTAILQTHKVTFAPRRKTMTLQRICG